MPDAREAASRHLETVNGICAEEESRGDFFFGIATVRKHLEELSPRISRGRNAVGAGRRLRILRRASESPRPGSAGAVRPDVGEVLRA